MAKSKDVTRYKIKYPEWLPDSDREEFLEDCIQHIRERTGEGVGAYSKGRGFQLKNFPAYSEEYEEKKGSSHVDLEFMGDMLASIDIINLKDGIIGVSDSQKGKAEGNILGTYGQGKPIKGKKRPFLGLTRQELNVIEAGFIREE